MNKMLQKYESNNIWLWLFGLRTSWLIYSIPNVDVSSTASSSFSSKTSGDGYGGRSKRLKHVWALKKLFVVKMYYTGHNLLWWFELNEILIFLENNITWASSQFYPIFQCKISLVHLIPATQKTLHRGLKKCRLQTATNEGVFRCQICW